MQTPARLNGSCAGGGGDLGAEQVGWLVLGLEAGKQRAGLGVGGALPIGFEQADFFGGELKYYIL